VTLLILQSEPDIDLLHTLDIEVGDGGDIIVTEQVEDSAGYQIQAMAWPADKAEAIAIAILRAAREARQQRLPLVLPIGLEAPRRAVQ
jgi:hypothetical protein